MREAGMSDLEVSIGEVIDGRYRIDRVIGQGGMGVVLAATHLQLEHPVAIKLMRSELAADETLGERFLREARAACRLRGEHVARVFDVGRLQGGAPYIVMELLEGRDLSVLQHR